MRLPPALLVACLLLASPALAQVPSVDTTAAARLTAESLLTRLNQATAHVARLQADLDSALAKQRLVATGSAQIERLIRRLVVSADSLRRLGDDQGFLAARESLAVARRDSTVLAGSAATAESRSGALRDSLLTARAAEVTARDAVLAEYRNATAVLSASAVLLSARMRQADSLSAELRAAGERAAWLARDSVRLAGIARSLRENRFFVAFAGAATFANLAPELTITHQDTLTLVSRRHNASTLDFTPVVAYRIDLGERLGFFVGLPLSGSYNGLLTFLTAGVGWRPLRDFPLDIAVGVYARNDQRFLNRDIRDRAGQLVQNPDSVLRAGGQISIRQNGGLDDVTSVRKTLNFYFGVGIPFDLLPGAGGDADR